MFVIKGIAMYLNEITILYVEDELETQEVIKEILNRVCKEVFIASDGVEGLEVYKDKEPDIVLSDIVMPNMNGIEMCQKIKEINPNQLIGLFTAYNEPEFKAQASELKIDSYIMKPFDDKQFFSALNYMAMAFHTDLNISKEL
ncbi:MAG: Two-component response regulator vanRB [uncultured Sulfurovum sp.]|uniref:Two-component response regulator vanRB n=1 Tax=uncultured Sulfurovum sp. TaxID=269237 RepID=A0A6S6STJ6_9BACT|nr:MAG: Two-component response regulator vanRB [uncultured Sulfurovum sp.]